MQEKDVLRRFLFDGLAVRGEWLNITASWQAAKQHHPYPEAVMQLLGEALAAATLLSAIIKFDGNLILQAQGNGSLKSLVAQSTNKLEIRGWARCDDAVTGKSLAELLGSGRLALTIEPAIGKPYQGIVPLTGSNLSQAVETYFSQSEQLKTRLWIFANQTQATALFIQELPAQKNEKTREDWQRIEALANTISEQELLSLSCEEVLHRLFNEEQVRLFSAEPISFKCRCSAEKVATTLVSLGRETVDKILAEQGEIIADCEFCSSKYHFDKIDIARVFSKALVHADSKTQH
ncbi:MAG: Hsp33 family molecular chaperone HslO [Gammaproteobacteria bacterium]|jgi:molecular chaperone Hsp33|nr:Hsp33 family molecular chaperone HslO [Gammaproteobacteria bacterium]MBT5223150.1 Hsp33 family molecular chaperone HslO [Gammaproteobacteria bacterium]MBT5825025.1 Hsp33 family molecular chaperone HslO [Gammaproteobacteria bacterium]MBT5966087.1 Hsp33 family molecular chaperone HslO [Gammaproteobacteria bacterium]MBT6419398.1 Hsp33 family molecular chaperone HslO [Gammaproteobacteria bacterium]